MSDKLEQSLDSIIKSKKKTSGGSGRGGARQQGGRPQGQGQGQRQQQHQRQQGGGGIRKPIAARMGGRGGSRVTGGGIRKPLQGGASNVRTILNTPSTARPAKPVLQRQQGPAGISRGEWSHDMFEKRSQGRQQGGNAGRRPAVTIARSHDSSSSSRSAVMHITNLHFDLSEKQLEGLFSKEAPLKKVVIHYDRANRSLGVADVHFVNSSDAEAVARKYNNAKIEGMAISTSIVN